MSAFSLSSLSPLLLLLNPQVPLLNTTLSANTTAEVADSKFNLPTTVLEQFIPGYGLIRTILHDLFGLDVSLLVTVLGSFFLLRTAGLYVYHFVVDVLADHFTCCIDMDEDDEPFASLMKWLVANRHTQRARSLKSAGRWWSNMMHSPQALLEFTEKTHGRTPGSSSRIFNYEALESKQPLGFEPDQGSYRFFHRGRLFFLRLYLKTYTHRHEDTVRVSVSAFGFSPDPIKQLLEEVRAADRDHEVATTEFFRAIPGDSDWRRVASRPSRPLNTIALDTTQKIRLVRDVNDFIHPSRERWYSSRGIPYRRGYLFSGPPGTGKTSLSLALAGVFGLALNAVSLQDPTMTEERLTQLFDYLPDRCVVLLEDIDSAGLAQQRQRTGTPSRPGTPVSGRGPRLETAPQDDEEKDKSKKTPFDVPNDNNTTSKISLAGLLNAIDGVASHEGHILIMTTNHPDQLDEALKRPGRIDMHIEFTLATKFQAREIFLRMYTDELPQSVAVHNGRGNALKETKRTNIERSGTVHTVESVCAERASLTSTRSCVFCSLEELDELAQLFVDSIPDMTLSPAELQGFLLVHKSDPAKAVEEVKTWAMEQVKAKDDKGKAGAVQIKVEDTDAKSDCSEGVVIEGVREEK